jgi:heat shock protein 5
MRMPSRRRRLKPSTSSRVSLLGRISSRSRSSLASLDQVYSAEASANDQEGLGGKLSSSDKKTIQTAVKEAKEWMEANGNDATAEDLEERQAEFSSTVQPIISSFYENAAGSEQETYGSHDEL